MKIYIINRGEVQLRYAAFAGICSELENADE